MRKGTVSRRFMGIASIAALAVTGLAACSSSDSGNGPTTEVSTSSEEQSASGEGSSNASTAPSETDASGEEVSLRVIVYTANPDQLALLDSLADGFKAEHPEVTDIQFESIATADLDKKLTAELGTADAPDASWMTVINAKRYIDAGVLVDLAPTLKSASDYEYDDLVQAYLSRWVVGDSQYGAPFSTSTQILYFNADLFDQAGVPTPDKMLADGTWDWEHFRQASDAIAKATNKPGFAPTLTNAELLYPLMYAYGAVPWNDAGDTCTMDSPEAISAMTMLHSMMYEDGSTTLPGQDATMFDGSAATSIAYLSSANQLADASFKWGVVPTPAGPAGMRPTVGQSAYVAFKDGKNPQLAAQLIEYITNAENAPKLAAYWVPSRASLLTAEKEHEAQPVLSVEQFQPILAGTVENGTVVPVSNSGDAAQGALRDALNEFLFKPDVDVAAAMKSVCGVVQPALTSR